MKQHKKSELHARLPQEDFDKLLASAEKEGMTISELTRHIVFCYLKNTAEEKNTAEVRAEVITSNSLAIINAVNVAVKISDIDEDEDEDELLALAILNFLKLNLDGFDFLVTDGIWAWGFGLLASDFENLEDAQSCLNSFISQLNRLDFTFAGTSNKHSVKEIFDSLQQDADKILTEDDYTPLACPVSAGVPPFINYELDDGGDVVDENEFFVDW